MSALGCGFAFFVLRALLVWCKVGLCWCVLKGVNVGLTAVILRSLLSQGRPCNAGPKHCSQPVHACHPACAQGPALAVPVSSAGLRQLLHSACSVHAVLL